MVLTLGHELDFPQSTQATHHIEIKVKERQKEDTVKLYCETISYLLQAFTTDDKMAKIYTGMMQFTWKPINSTTEYPEAMWNKVLWWNQVYEDYLLKDISIKRFLESIHHIMGSFWALKNKAAVQDFAHPAVSLAKLQHSSSGLEAHCKIFQMDRWRENRGYRGFYASNTNLNSSSLFKSSVQHASSNQSWSSTTAMSIQDNQP